jgi:uncharacterized protein
MHCIHDGPPGAACRLILAHGAGEGPESPFLSRVAEGLARGGVAVTRFAFPYTEHRTQGGARRPPDSQPVLLDTWRRAITDARAGGRPADRLAIGGKSLGGRMASLIADEVGAAALVCLGYPFHPPGRPERLRTEHLAGLRTPALICQGTRDPFGRPDEVSGYRLSPAIRLAWIPDGDHSLVPTKASERTWEDNLDQAVREVLDLLARCCRERRA